MVDRVIFIIVIGLLAGKILGGTDMLTVKMGTPFDVELSSGPSTGYIWELKSLPEGILLLGTDYVENNPATIGGGGVQVFHLKTERPGHFSLPFVHKRKWETEPIETKIIEVDSQ